MIDRNESLRDKIATIVQAGYSQRKTSVETADEIRSKISFLFILTGLERENDELRAIIDATLRALPVGNVRTHTPDSIPERVGDLVKAHADELADNEQLRKDKARLDWLDHNAIPWRWMSPELIDKLGPIVVTWKGNSELRSAIDAAMEANP